MSPERSRILTLIASLALLALPTTASAQDDDGGMSFGVDEVDPVEEDGDGGGEGDGGMSFGVEEVEEEGTDGGGEEFGQQGGTNTSVVAVPTSAITAEQREELQREMMKSMQNVADLQINGSGGVLGGLRERDAEQCVRETICLSTVGSDAGYDKLVLGRITKIGEQWRLDIDYFDVNERQFIKYKAYENLGSYKEALGKVDPAIREVFDIRDVVEGPEVEEEPRNEWIQPAFAYTTAALAVGCLAGGAVFGVRARDARTAIIESPKTADGGRYEDLTQEQAQSQFNQAQRTARRANTFYALGVGLGVVSAVLFAVDFGSDVATEEELSSRRPRDLKFTPAVTTRGAGVGASFRF